MIVSLIYSLIKNIEEDTKSCDMPTFNQLLAIVSNTSGTRLKLQMGHPCKQQLFQKDEV